MKIGFDITQTGYEKTGCGYFAYSLLRALSQVDAKNRYLLYPSFGEDYWPGEIASPVESRRFSQVNLHASLSEADRFWRNSPASLENALRRPDLVHANNFYTPIGLRRARLVYTLYDISFFENPQWHTVNNWAVVSKGIFRAARLADGMVAISEYSKKHFLEYFPRYPAERIWVAPLASRFPLDPVPVRPDFPSALVPDGFWLSVGTLEPRKNHLVLLQAYAAHARAFPHTPPLVLVGAKGWKSDHLRALTVELGIAERVILLGYVSDEVLQGLYQNCYAFLYPSLFEGFGLPVLEALSLGAAVITSNATSLPEVAGDAALMVNPAQPAELTAALNRLLTEPALRARLKAAAPLQAQQFSWQKTAVRVLEVYEQVMRLPKLAFVYKEDQ